MKKITKEANFWKYSFWILFSSCCYCCCWLCFNLNTAIFVPILVKPFGALNLCVWNQTRFIWHTLVDWWQTLTTHILHIHICRIRQLLKFCRRILFSWYVVLYQYIERRERERERERDRKIHTMAWIKWHFDSFIWVYRNDILQLWNIQYLFLDGPGEKTTITTTTTDDNDNRNTTNNPNDTKMERAHHYIIKIFMVMNVWPI